jgi:hypothetical protein
VTKRTEWYRAALRTTVVLLVGSAPIASIANGAPRARTVRGSQPESHVLFDDFSYSSRSGLAKHGWIIRTAAGWPGLPDATWAEESVAIVKDPERSGNRILRLTSSTDGSGANTHQSQVCQQRKFLEGTYAARVRFRDDPSLGPAGDQFVASFYQISPLKAPMDLDYSELDWEYLANGGWGIPGATLYATTWETFSPEPNWKKDNVFDTVKGTEAGWHVLVTQVADGKVKYFIDGKQIAEHGGEYFPESFMSINFNLWFIKDGTIPDNRMRHYQEEIDWVYHEANTVLSPYEVEARVADMRRRSIKFVDTVPAPVPALTSPCDF